MHTKNINVAQDTHNRHTTLMQKMALSGAALRAPALGGTGPGGGGDAPPYRMPPAPGELPGVSPRAAPPERVPVPRDVLLPSAPAPHDLGSRIPVLGGAPPRPHVAPDAPPPPHCAWPHAASALSEPAPRLQLRATYHALRHMLAGGKPRAPPPIPLNNSAHSPAPPSSLPADRLYSSAGSLHAPATTHASHERLDTQAPAPRSDLDSDEGGFRAQPPPPRRPSPPSSDIEVGGGCGAGGLSSCVDSGRGSAAYSSGPGGVLPRARSAPTAPPAPPSPGTGAAGAALERELRHILEPRLRALQLEPSSPSATPSPCSAASLTPPLPPLSPEPPAQLPPPCQPRHHRSKRASLPPPRDNLYRKQLFGLDTTDVTSETTRSLDLSSLLGARSEPSESEVGGRDARAIRRQLRGLETMYGEVLQLLGVRGGVTAGTTRRHHAAPPSSLGSSSVSSRAPRRRPRASAAPLLHHDHKSVKARFQRLESHVVTLARSVAHLSSEMRAHHLLVQEMEGVRGELAALRLAVRTQAAQAPAAGGAPDPRAFTDPERVRRLTKFFGQEPPLMRYFLRRLGYERYAGALEAERVGAAELPYVGEERLRALGVPLGPRLRILREAGLRAPPAAPRALADCTATTLAIV